MREYIAKDDFESIHDFIMLYLWKIENDFDAPFIFDELFTIHIPVIYTGGLITEDHYIFSLDLKEHIQEHLRSLDVQTLKKYLFEYEEIHFYATYYAKLAQLRHAFNTGIYTGIFSSTILWYFLAQLFECKSSSAITIAISADIVFFAKYILILTKSSSFINSSHACNLLSDAVTITKFLVDAIKETINSKNLQIQR